MAASLAGCVAVAAGGAAGCLCRYWVQQMPLLGADRSWPTLAVNIAGCLLIGIIATLIDHRGTYPLLRLMIVTGFLGGLTTYSTFTLDAATMTRAGELLKALGYVAVTLLSGFAAYAGGLLIARAVIDYLKL